MTGERYVVLGLAHPRAEWFRSLAAWAMSGALPVEFTKCVSAEEVRAHLGAGRAVSAVLLDAGLPATDRDLIGAVRDAGAVVLVVDAPGVASDWERIGAATVLPSTPSRADVLDALRAHAHAVSEGEVALPEQPEAAPAPAGGAAAVAMVCGPGGTGASTVAMALAQGLAQDVAQGRARRRSSSGAARGVTGQGNSDGDAAPGPVLLADLCRHADQAVLHDAPDVTPSVQELVEAHRGRWPSLEEVLGHTFAVEARGYHLLLGLRRPHHWSMVRTRSFHAAFSSLLTTFATVVCDVTADFEGEAEGGSRDVEERNLMARTAAARASCVLAVGAPGVKGLASLVRLLGELQAAGVPTERTVPVINRAPRSRASRAGLARALADLDDRAERPGPVFVPAKRIDESVRDGARVPDGVAAPLVGAYHSVLRREGRREPPSVAAEPVPAGTLGSFADLGVDPDGSLDR